MNGSSVRSKQVQLQGPRPAPLMISKNSTKITKKSSQANRPGPVIVYLKSPDVIHVRPEEFMGLVQRLTGKPAVSGGGGDGGKKGLIGKGQGVEFDGCDQVGQKQKFDGTVDSNAPLSAFSSFCLNIYTDW